MLYASPPIKMRYLFFVTCSVSWSNNPPSERVRILNLKRGFGLKNWSAYSLVGRCVDLTICAIMAIPLALASSTCFAESAELQAQELQGIFENFCVKYIDDLDGLKSSLDGASTLPPQQAEKYLGLSAGSSWVMPSEQGFFVLSIPEGQEACHVTARRVDPKMAESLFVNFAASAPALYSARKVADFDGDLGDAGSMHTIVYAWIQNDSIKKIMLGLTVGERDVLDIQAVAYVKISTR